MSHTRRLSFALLLLSVTPLRSMAAEPEWLPDLPGQYRPTFFTNGAAPQIATAAELRALRAEWQKLDTIIRAAPLAAKPIGFNPWVGGVLHGEYGTFVPVGKGQPLPFHWGYTIYPLLRDPRAKNGVGDVGESKQWTFDLNAASYFRLLPMVSAERLEFFGDIGQQPERTNDILGMPAYTDNRGVTNFVLTHSNAPLFVPVTLEEVRKVQIRIAERDRDKQREFLQSEEERIRNAPAERARIMREATELAAQLKRPAAEFVEPQVKGFDQGMQTAIQRMPSLRAALAKADKLVADLGASITAADRTAQACSNGAILSPIDPAYPFQLFLRSGAPECRPLARLNWKQLFNPALPRTAPQLLVIDGDCWRITQDYGGRCAMYRKILEAVDWGAVRAWVK